MYIIVAFIFVLCIVFAMCYSKDRVSSFCLFSFVIYWGVSLFASCFNPFGMSTNSDETYFILILGMISFVLGFILFEFRTSVSEREINIIRLKEKVSAITKGKLLNILYIGCTAFAMKFMVTALIMSQINGGTLSGDDRGEILFEGSYMYKFFYHFIMNPLYYVTLSFLCVVVLTKIRKRMLFCIISVSFIIASVILSGGRNKFVIILMYFLFSYVCVTKNIRYHFFRIRNIVVYSVVGILMFIAMALQTGFRSTGTYSLTGDDFTESIISMGETFGVYSVIPIRLFDYALNNYYFDKFGGAKYGRASVAGFDGIATGVIRRFSGIEIESTLEIVDYLQDNEIYIIPGNHPYNYCYTALFFCYMDLGVFGVIIIPFFFGLLFRYYIFQLYKYSSLPAFILVCFGYFMMMHSLFQTYFVKNWTMPFCLVVALIQYVYYTKGMKFVIGGSLKTLNKKR